MKALKANLSVNELRKTIGKWKSRKITDSTISKLLDLYLGMTAYMNQERMYPVEKFYDIKISLRFPTTQALVEAIKTSQSFGFVLDEEQKQIKAFYSPLWHDKDSEIKTNTSSEPADETPNLQQTFAQTFAVNNNIYNISKESSSSEEVSPDGEEVSANISSKTNIVTTYSLAAAKEFFHLINEDAAQKAQILKPLIDWYQKHERLTRAHARENLVYLVNELLVPYFTEQPGFMKANHIGRLAWLNNLLKSVHGQHLLIDASKGARLKREQAIREIKSNQRNNHPLSEFEWTDPETGMRFYDDDIEGMVNIPSDAPPRPSAAAIWNVLSNQWP